jgi:hypothetical protein
MSDYLPNTQSDDDNSTETTEAKFYTYVHSIDGKPIYVGKGTADRFARFPGSHVVHIIHVSSEDVALELERLLIWIFKNTDPDTLQNVRSGSLYGRKEAFEACKRFLEKHFPDRLPEYKKTLICITFNSVCRANEWKEKEKQTASKADEAIHAHTRAVETLIDRGLARDH